MAGSGRWLRDPRVAAAAVLLGCTATAFVAFAGEPVRSRATSEPATVDPGPGNGDWREAPSVSAPVAPPVSLSTIPGPRSPVPGPRLSPLADLQRASLSRDPAAAPGVIHSIAVLGASAGPAERNEAATTLASWLRDESKRDAPDALGNISNLVEALGDLGGPSAVTALADALDRADLALHVETLAVMKLGELGDAHARSAVERFATRAAALPGTDGIDEELRIEALAAATTTLSRL